MQIDPSSTEALLRSVDRKIDQVKALAVHIERQNRDRPRATLSPATILAKTVTAQVLAAHRGSDPAAVADELYGERLYADQVTRGLANFGAIIRAAIAPAQTTVAGWASELVTPGNLGTLQIIAPASIYSQLSKLPATIRVSLAGHGSVKVPSRAPTPTLAAPFVGEGLPIAVRQLALSNATLSSKKAPVISVLTLEMLNHSLPDLEQIIRDAMAADTSVSIDGVLLSSAAGTAIAPPGLLAGISATGATSGGGLAAFAGDTRALAGAIEATGPLVAPVLIMSSTSALMLATLTQNNDLPVIASPTVPSKQLIMVDTANFASGEGDTPSIVSTQEANLHLEDTTPLPLASGTTGSAVLAAPQSSMFQTACIAIRLLQDLGWTMTRPGRVAYVNSVSW